MESPGTNLQGISFKRLVVIVFIIGVAGSGKSRVGSELASALTTATDLCWNFKDADDYHSEKNRLKMKAGIALTDEDRKVWIARLEALIRSAVVDRQSLVLAYSGLKRAHRQRLAQAAGERSRTFCLTGDVALIGSRLKKRQAEEGHFMPPEQLADQLHQFEAASSDEHLEYIDVSHSVGEVVNRIKNKLLE